MPYARKTRPEAGKGVAKMPASLSTYDGAFVRLRELGAELRACAPMDLAEQLADVATELMVSRATQPSAAALTARTTEWLATRFDAASGVWR
jgi:hypothetical protein